MVIPLSVSSVCLWLSHFQLAQFPLMFYLVMTSLCCKWGDSFYTRRVMSTWLLLCVAPPSHSQLHSTCTLVSPVSHPHPLPPGQASAQNVHLREANSSQMMQGNSSIEVHDQMSCVALWVRVDMVQVELHTVTQGSC